MEWLFILLLGGAAIFLFDRSRKLERRLSELEHRLIEPRVDAAPQTADAATRAQEAPPGDRSEPPSQTAAKPASRLAPASASASFADPFTAPHVAPTQTESEPEGEQATEPLAGRGKFTVPALDFEDIFGRRLPIWAGGIALAAGGIFLVIYAIEQGLMGPVTRVALSLVFGAALLVAAELAYRFEERVRDPRVRQALAGAGIATLYAAAYLAGAQYGLIGPAIAFGGLALITAGALALTLRFGLPTAVLGLVGGFATPVLVASEEANVPVLAFYLALLTAGLAVTARRTGHRWLGAAGLAGGFGWGVLMLAGGPATQGDVVAIGLYLLAIGAAVPLLVAEHERWPIVRVAAGGLAAVQMAALVSLAGFSLLDWGLYGLLAAALAVLSWRTEEVRPAGLLVTALAALLLGAWPAPDKGEFVLVALALGIVLLGAPLVMLREGRGAIFALAQASGGALAFGLAAWRQFGNPDNEVMLSGLALGLAGLAGAAGCAVWLAWRNARLDGTIALPIAAGAVLAFGAFHVALPDWAEVLGAVAVTLVLTALARARLRAYPVLALAWIGGLVTLATLLTTGDQFDELVRAFGAVEGEVDLSRALIRWGSGALPFAALAVVEPLRRMRRLAEVLAVLVGYVFVANILPGPVLAWTAALAAMALVWTMKARTGLWGTGIVLGMLWALAPVGAWLMAGIAALTGEPARVTDLPDPAVILRCILPLALAAGVATWRTQERPVARVLLAVLAGLCATITLHVLFKQLFAIDDAAAFVAYGLAERTLWEAALVGAGLAAMRFAPIEPARRVGAILATAGLAHFAWFTLVLHNPLWSDQATGSLPLANLLAPAYLVAGTAVWWLSRRWPDALAGHSRQVGDAAIMVLIVLWSLSELRHAFAGSVLVAIPMSQTEDLLRSFVGIVLALVFLWWGSIRQQRSWRIGSLVLILMAVLKVFLVDAAGLEGLLRVASFIALGASLIAIGWVYSRQLSNRDAAPPDTPTSS